MSGNWISRDPLLGVLHDESIAYPAAEDSFSPSDRYPEYEFEHLSKRPNCVYEAVRRMFRQCNLDEANYGKPTWNPLGEFIKRDSRVFVLCNFVYHRRPGETQKTFWSKCTHGSVLRAVLDYILLAVGPRGRVSFGNAPLQSCDWQRVMKETGAAQVLRFYRRRGIGVEARDLRLFVLHRDLLGRVVGQEHRDQNGNMVQIDLGSTSLFAALKNSKSARFRVSDYDPRRTEECHANGRHIYLFHREVMDADVVFSLPKLKTHEKVGITCGLKGFVGTIAQKDCLAHHRFGSPAENGDEFPGSSAMRTFFSELHDHINMRVRNSPTTDLLRVIDQNARRLIRLKGGVTFGGWYGNDTAWRMALDIARILLYANRNGVMSNSHQRTHLLMVDGIVGGEKEGPLSPSPFDSGLLLFTDDVALGDWACCLAMGFDPLKIPLVREAFSVSPFPVSELHPGSCMVYLNGRYRPIKDLEQVLDHPFAPPRGWKGHAERDPGTNGAGQTVTL